MLRPGRLGPGRLGPGRLGHKPQKVRDVSMPLCGALKSNNEMCVTGEFRIKPGHTDIKLYA